MLFFVIFSIIGVNYFKGAFFHCHFGQNILFSIVDLDTLIVTKFDCYNYGGAWEQQD